MTRRMRVFAVFLAALAAGCSRKPSEAPSAKAAPPTPAAAAASSEPGPLSIAKFRFGTAFGPDGAVSTEASVIAPGETACVSFDVYNLAPGAKVRVSWIHLPDKKGVAREEVSVSPAKPFVAVKSETRGWAPGEYLVDIAMVTGDVAASLGTMNFTVSKDRAR